MSNQVKVSVIIPVYQVENYLERAVDSVLAQTLEEKEIILDRNGNNTGKIKVTKKHIPPDLDAIIIIKNMIDSGKW